MFHDLTIASPMAVRNTRIHYMSPKVITDAAPIRSFNVQMHFFCLIFIVQIFSKTFASLYKLISLS